MTTRFYSSVAQATSLSGSITSGATSMAVLSTAGFPTSYPYTLAVDFGAAAEELVDVTNAAGLTLTITRASDGTSAASHSAGAVVRHVASARDFTDSRTHENASTNVHGLSGGAAVVGDTQTQTLTNKTLTSPTVNTPTITNPTMTGGGSLAGTYTGTPTFSGALTLSGSPIITSPAITGGSLAGTITGTPTLSGALTLSGSPIITSPAITGGSLAGTISGSPTLSGTVALTGTVNHTGAAATFNEVTLTNNATGDLPFIVNGIAGTTAKLASLRVNASEKFAVDSAGQITVGPTWSTYTPSWTATSGTNPALGNGSISGHYVQVGKLLFLNAQVIFGTTTTFGTSQNWQFSLPGGFTLDQSFDNYGSALIQQNSNAGSTYTGVVGLIDSTHFSAVVSSPNTNGSAVSTNGFLDSITPDTLWNNGGKVVFQATFQIA